MKAVVVYESLWGNTAAIARSIAEGIGPDAVALTTDEATGPAIEGADLIVAGAPLLGFNLPTDAMRDGIRKDKSAPPPDLAHPSMRSWLETVPDGTGRCCGFETRIWWSPGSAAKKMLGGAAKPRLLGGGQGREVHRHGQVRPAQGRRARTCAAVGRPAGEVARPEAPSTSVTR